MPSNQTKNYQLSQWVKSDKVLMDDFNEDNAKIDAALAEKAEKTALAALETTVSKKAEKADLDALSKTVTSHTTALDGKGNCKIYTDSYPGTGDYDAGHPNKLTFPGKPAVVFIGDRTNTGNAMFAFYGQKTVYAHASSYSMLTLTWSDNTLSWYNHISASGQLNQSGVTYDVVALIEL